MNIFNSLEIGLLHNLHDTIRCDFLDWFMPIITSLSNAGIFWVLLAGFFLCFRNTRKIGITMGIAIILGLIIGNLTLKPLIARIRPYDFDPSIVLLVSPEHDYSFPSGHTLAAFEGAFSLFLYHKKTGTAAMILAAMIAFSRLYLMVHYPLDVIAGTILGTLLAFAAYKITEQITNKSAGKL